MIAGWKKLNKTERKHVHKDAGCRSTAAFQRNIDEQAKKHREFGGNPPCWDCFFIAKKVGLTPEGGWKVKEKSTVNAPK